jgi:hypothetical protein
MMVTMDEILITQALDMMRNSPDLAADAHAGAPVRNTIIGSLLAIEYKCPRWAAEHFVRIALSELHGIREKRSSAR